MDFHVLAVEMQTPAFLICDVRFVSREQRLRSRFAELLLSLGSHFCVESVVLESQPIILVVDDDEAFLDSLATLLASMGYLAKCYASGDEFLRDYQDGAASCLILDLKMPGLDGFAVLDNLAKLVDPPSVIVLTGKVEVADAVRAVRHGVVSYLQKQSLSEASLWEAIQQALSRHADRRAVHQRSMEVQTQLARLTVPESLVLELILKGKELSAIAAILGISRRTVESRRAKMMEKLGVSTIPALIRLAVEAGIVKDNPS